MRTTTNVIEFPHRPRQPSADELLRAANDFPDLYASFRADDELDEGEFTPASAIVMMIVVGLICLWLAVGRS